MSKKTSNKDIIKALEEGQNLFKKDSKLKKVGKKVGKAVVKKLPYIGAAVTAGLALNQVYETLKSEKNRRDKKKKEVIDSPSGAKTLFENSKTKP